MNDKILTISIIIPTHNGVENLRRVFGGVERQTRIKRVVEVIVVDDASTMVNVRSLYEKILKEFPTLPIEVIYFAQNKGPAAARNAGIVHARGDIIFFTDDDVSLPENTLELHLDEYEKKPTISGVGGWYQASGKAMLSSVIERYVLARDLVLSDFALYRQSSSFGNSESILVGNTANLSVKTFVAREVLFDEDFITPGSEDSFFVNEIMNKRYLVKFIPHHVIHTKHLGNIFSFIKLCKNRGIGMFVYSAKYGLPTPGMNLSDITLFNRKLLQHARTVPFLKENQIMFLFLHAIRVFYTNSKFMARRYRAQYLRRFDAVPARKYFR